MLFLIILVGIFQSWSIALSILNYCLISAVMTIGANLQWGYAGLINFGIMGYTALGGLAVVLISVAPVPEAWSAGGLGLIICLLIIVLMVLLHRSIVIFCYKMLWRLISFRRCRIMATLGSFYLW